LLTGLMNFSFISP